MSTANELPPTLRAPAGDSRTRRGLAALLGIVAVGITFAVAELLARTAAWVDLSNPYASPFHSLGDAFITITPEWLKDFGVRTFGQSDKMALAIIMIVVFALVGAAVGLIGRVSDRVARWVAGAIVVVVGVAIITRPAASAGDLVPIAAGGAAGIAFLHTAFRPRYDEVLGWGPPRGGGPSGRRRALRMIGIGALSAAVAGIAARLVPGIVNVQASRDSVVLPPLAPTTATGPGAAEPSAAGPSAAGPSAASPPTADISPGPGSTGLRPAKIVIPPALPYGANPDIPELTPFVTDASRFYRVDTAFVLPRVAADTWTLKVHGQVRHPFEISWTELLAMPQIERWITLTCVSNEVGGDLVGNAAWQGVRVADLLARAQPLDGADCAYSTSADNFTVTTPLGALTDGRDALLAIGMNGAPLPIEHGFPVRLVVPGLYGYVSATKWVVDIEVTTFAETTAYWTERGWSERGPIKTASRIDTPHYGVSVKPGVVPIAGVAWAQHRGISAVQVQVDDGPWRDARLQATASVDTWVQWVYEFDTRDVAPGSHRVSCRAVDGAGVVQSATVAPPPPNGASGYHTISMVTS